LSNTLDAAGNHVDGVALADSLFGPRTRASWI
jgi:hypothetical protein